MAAKTPPEYPITDEQVTEFQRLVGVWRKRLHLMNWRIHKTRRRPAAHLAEVQMYPEHRLARYSVGRDWGSEPPDKDSVERTVIHELLHVRFNQMLDAAMREQEYNEVVQGEEHDVIVALEETLSAMTREIEELKRELGEAKKAHRAE